MAVTDDPAYIVDIPGLEAGGPQDRRSASDGPPGPMLGRPWVGIRFDCCGVYNRIYRSADGTRYSGRCPRCTKQVSLRVGTGGTSCRFFVAE